jgi:hypothetical protein
MNVISTINSISINSLKSKTELEQDADQKKKSDKNKDAVESAQGKVKVVGTCMKALMESIPPSFCFKKGADFGVIPTGCPHGYFRSLALCYEYCKPGFVHVLGICWEKCPDGTTDIGLICGRGILDWWFKRSYIPDSLTNFNDNVPCPEGMYRFGALCYRDCNNIGMHNCGIGACAASKVACGTEIAFMVLDVLTGLADAVLFVLTFGTEQSAISKISKGLQKIGKLGLKGILGGIKNLFKSEFRKTIIEMAKKKLKDVMKKQIEDTIKDFAKSSALTLICQTVWRTAIDRTATEDDLKDSLISAVDIFGVQNNISKCKEGDQQCANAIISGVKDFDPTGILSVTATLTSCTDVSSENKSIECANNIISGLSAFDPTGLLTIAAAFLKPVCEVTTDVPVPSQETLDLEKELQKIEDYGCIYLYEHPNFQGRVEKVCSTTYLLQFNDVASSMKTGKNASGVLFEHKNSQGRSFPFGPNMIIPDFSAFNYNNFKLNDIVSSVNFEAQNCLIINFRSRGYGPGESMNKILCNDKAKIDDIGYTESWAEYIDFLLYKDNIVATIYSEYNFKGKSMTFSKSRRFTPPFENYKIWDILSVKIRKLEPVKRSCIILYSDENYSGEQQEICESSKFVPWSFFASSMRSSENVKGVLWSQENLQGESLAFSHNENINFAEKGFDKKTVSVRLEVKEDPTMDTVESGCIYLYEDQGYQGSKMKICKASKKIPFPKTTSSIRAANDVQGVLFSEENYTGSDYMFKPGEITNLYASDYDDKVTSVIIYPA